jgi:hypothetical protein
MKYHVCTFISYTKAHGAYKDLESTLYWYSFSKHVEQNIEFEIGTVLSETKGFN